MFLSCFFFFKQKTAYEMRISDWSSDVCSSDLLSCISGDAKYQEVAWSHRAKAAMMVCSKAMINVARKMEERYGIPFFEGSFYGIGDMSDSLREIARLQIGRAHV